MQEHKKEVTKVISELELEVLRPSQHYEGHVKVVSLPTHTFTGQA